MNIDFMALLKSKILWANVIGVAIALCGVLGVTPEMTGKTAEYTGVAINVITIILRMFGNGSNSVVTLKK
jgi:protein-S-isoprenylcysteine O-methyltransferase Ste14